MSVDAVSRSTKADELFASAKRVLPGGVSAAARVHASIGRPFFASRGEGGRVWDLDGREYIDLNMSFGAALLGHGNPVIRQAIESALDMGVLCAFETPFQTEVARKITELVPCAELVRFTQSGTETTWHAVRTARAYTGRTKVIKFEGHFHGFNDTLGYSMWPDLAEAGPPDAPATLAASGGMPPWGATDIIVLPWNDLDRPRTMPRHPSRGDRGGHHGAHRLQRRDDSSLAGLPPGRPRADPPARRRPDLRRDPVGLSHWSRRRAGVPRRHAGPVHAWQVPGGRDGAERVRWLPRGDGGRGPARLGRAQWDVQRPHHPDPRGQRLPGPHRGPGLLA